jgi:hypothetical protein
VGDDPEGEVDGDAAAAEVRRILVPRVRLQEVPEASPHAHLSLSRRRRVRRWRRVSNGSYYAGAPGVSSGLPRALSWVGFPVSARAHQCVCIPSPFSFFSSFLLHSRGELDKCFVFFLQCSTRFFPRAYTDLRQSGAWQL